MHQELSLAISINEQFKDRCQTLAKHLSLPLCSTASTDERIKDCIEFDFILRYEAKKSYSTPVLSLDDTHGDIGGSINVDFVGGKMGHRRRYGGGRGQPLAKAIGLKGGANPMVVDATAGLGRDAFVLASLGAQVILLERSPVLSALLEDGLNRALADREVSTIVHERMKLINTNAIEWLKEPTIEQQPDVIYMDPMYPHRNKSALVKKEMRYLREIVGEDEDASLLLHAALSCAKHRVVVKRPRTAPIVSGTILSNRRPNTAVESKNTRYDIYVI